jgi:hypothetical protein
MTKRANSIFVTARILGRNNARVSNRIQVLSNLAFVIVYVNYLILSHSNVNCGNSERPSIRLFTNKLVGLLNFTT